MEIFPTNAVFEPGHRLRSAITTGDFQHQGPNLSTLANSTGGVTTLYFDAAHASRVYLGAVQPAAAPAATPTQSAAAGVSSARQTVRGRPAPSRDSAATGMQNTAGRIPLVAPLAGALFALSVVCAAGARRWRRRSVA